MLRGLILLVLAIGVAVLALPIVATKKALDAHGITVPGTVYHKSETVLVDYSGWTCRRELTVKFTDPETRVESFLVVQPDLERYDALHLHQPIEVRHLLRTDVPKLPLSDILWQIRALPVSRLADAQGTSTLAARATPALVLFGKLLLGLAVLAILWRITRSSLFAWALGIGVALLVGAMLLSGIPRATPALSTGNIRRAQGRVKSIDTINKLFNGPHERGLDALEPVSVVGVEFVPEGRTEPVVAVDLIDAGSLPGLAEKALVPLEYDGGTPRTAHLVGATRTFPKKNGAGVVLQAALYLAVVGGLFALAHWLGKGYRRITARVAR